jgi:hypothetical protein
MSLIELLEYCEKHSERIYVREQLSGCWGSYKLSDLSFNLAMKHIWQWFQEGRIPTIEVDC